MGTWLYIDSREEPDLCRQPLWHERSSTALGAEHEPGLSRAGLGVAVERVTTGPRLAD